MTPLIEDVVAALRAAGWTVELAAEPRTLPAAIAERHRRLPPLALEFMGAVDRCMRGDEGCWLLTARDYGATDPPGAFGWDAFEQMMLEDDIEAGERRAIVAFWNRRLPILCCVAGDYQYVALCTDRAGPDAGKVVHGEVVDFDSPLVIADSYEDFLVQLRDVARAPATRSTVQANDLALLIHPEITEDMPARPGLLVRIRGWLS